MRMLAAPRSAAQRCSRPAWGDGLLAFALLAVALPHPGPAGTVGLMLSALLVLPLLWRRQAPVAAFAAMWGVAAVQGIVSQPTFTDCALLVALYTVATSASRRTALIAFAALELANLFAAARFSNPGVDHGLEVFVTLSAMATAAAVLGRNVANRRQTLSALRERAARLEQEREHEVERATVAERSRIAREMHDVVAHNLSVMVALCDGASFHIYEDPERAESALEQAAQTGREALTEMRQLLGVLRDAPGDPERAPQPGIRELDDLVEQMRAAGVPVSFRSSGHLADASPGLELTIYRIVQEALTNTLKHAGPGASATVTLTCTPETVDIRVRDTGVGGDAPAGGSGPARTGGSARPGGGGLPGMRERAAVYGGTLEAGPCAESGWLVHASLRAQAPAADATPGLSSAVPATALR